MNVDLIKRDEHVNNNLYNLDKNSADNKNSERRLKGTPYAVAMSSPVGTKKTNSGSGEDNSNRPQRTEHSIAMNQTLSLDSSNPANTDISSRNSQTSSITNQIRSARRTEKYIYYCLFVMGCGLALAGLVYVAYARISGTGSSDISDCINSDNPAADSSKKYALDAVNELNHYRKACACYACAAIIHFLSLWNKWNTDCYVNKLEKNNHRPTDD